MSFLVIILDEQRSSTELVPKPTIDFAVFLALFSEARSFVPTWNITWHGLFSRRQGLLTLPLMHSFWQTYTLCLFSVFLHISHPWTCLMMLSTSIKILANSANTKSRPFQVKIYCSKFIIDRLQSWCYLTFLFSLFVTSRNLLFGVFLTRENSRKYQASVTERCISFNKRSGMFRQNLLKVPMKN